MTSVKKDIYINLPIYPVPLCFHSEVSSERCSHCSSWDFSWDKLYCAVIDIFLCGYWNQASLLT